jgi:multicomponent Na+:H+ antiporter subunit A
VLAADLAGLARTAPLLGLTLVLALAALAGIPPAAGFTARWAGVGAAWRDGWYVSAAVVVVAVVGGAATVAAPLRALLGGRGTRPAVILGAADRFALALTGVLLLAAGTMPGPVFHWAGRLVALLR